jgi:hypothetical protein
MLMIKKDKWDLIFLPILQKKKKKEEKNNKQKKV